LADLSAITKANDLLRWLLPALDKFPRSRKFTLGDRIETMALDILCSLIEARYLRQKTAVLNVVNLKLETLRHLVRLSKDLNCMSIKGYEHASKLLVDLGREVGGWLKQQRGKDETA
jgi:hypothetical protein